MCIAPRREHTSKALRYGMCSQGISQFYLQTPRSSANGVNHTCLCLCKQRQLVPQPQHSWLLLIFRQNSCYCNNMFGNDPHLFQYIS